MKRVLSILLTLVILTGLGGMIFLRLYAGEDGKEVPAGEIVDDFGQPQDEDVSAQSSVPQHQGDPSLMIDSALDSGPTMTVLVEDREETYPFSGDIHIKSMARLDASLLFLGERGERAVMGLSDYTVMEDGRPSVAIAKELAMAPLPFEGEAIYYAVTAGDDGNFYLLAGNNRNGTSTALAVQRYSRTGDYIDCMEIPDWDLSTVAAFSVGSDGEFVLAVDDRVCVYRWAEGLLKRSKGDYYVYSSSASGAGLIVSVFSMEDHRARYYRIDRQTGALAELPLSETDPNDRGLWVYRISTSLAPCQGLGEEYLMNEGNSICRVDFETDTLEKLIDWNPNMQPDMEVGTSCRLGESSFACLLDGKLVLAWSHTVEKRESGVVRVGMIDMRGAIEKKVKSLNNSSCPYTYEVTSFDWGEGDKLRVELAAGKFDLVLFYGELNTVSNSFEDLYPYIDADPDLSREAFLPNLLESTSVHGELHQIWNSIYINTMTAPADVVGDGRGLSAADCEALVEKTAGLQSVFDNKFSDVNGLKWDTLQNIAYIAMTAFVDKENAECRFDSREFMDLLSLVNRMKANPDSNGHDWLLSNDYVFSAEYISAKEVFVGYPDGGDGIQYYALPNDFENCMTMAIPSNSQSKIGAWYFIKTMLSHSSQSRMPYGMPVIYDVLREATERIADAQTAEKFYDLLERTRYAQMSIDDTLREIILNSSQAYLAGTKSLEETAKLIQSKASIYVAELYG